MLRLCLSFYPFYLMFLALTNECVICYYHYSYWYLVFSELTCLNFLRFLWNCPFSIWTLPCCSQFQAHFELFPNPGSTLSKDLCFLFVRKSVFRNEVSLDFFSGQTLKKPSIHPSWVHIHIFVLFLEVNIDIFVLYLLCGRKLSYFSLIF